MKMNHVVSGLGLNLLAAGATRYLSIVVFPSTGIVSKALPKPFFMALALLLPLALHLLLTRTKFGLRLRAVGENPESARMAGIAPAPARYAAVTLSGALAALAGACLLSDVPTLIPSLAVNTNDSITISESVSVVKPLLISVSESLSVSDSPSLFVPWLAPNVSDSISVATVPTVAAVPPMESVSPVRKPAPLKVTVLPGAPDALLSAREGMRISTAPMSHFVP